MSNATQATDDLGLSDGIEYDAKVTDAYFSYPPSYKNGEVLVLVLELETDSGEDRQQYFTLGNNWEPVEGGAKVSPINPRRQKVDRKSGLGNLVATAAEAGALDALKAQAEGSNPVWKNAGIWKGLTFGFAQRELSFTDRVTGEERKYSRLDVTAFLPDGLDGANDSGGASGSAAGGAKLDDVKTRAALKVVAATSANYEQFVERALIEVDGVEQSDEWSAKLLNDALYNELRTS
jgi:hypothetical protein